MLRILGTRKTLCDGLCRRDFLQIGGLGVFGLGLADAMALQAAITGLRTLRALSPRNRSTLSRPI